MAPRGGQQPNTVDGESKATPRVNSGRLLKILLVSAIVPLSLLLLLDVVSGLLPLLTLVGLLIFIPAGSFFIVRAALDEFSQVIEEVAPVEPEPNELANPADDVESLPPLAPES